MFSDILTIEQRQALGAVVIESAVIDGRLEWMIWYLSKLTNKTGPMFTEGLQISGKLKLLTQLLQNKHLNKKQLQKLEILNSTLSNAIRDRNTVVHGNWEYEIPHPKPNQLITLADFFDGLAGKAISKHKTPKSKTTRTMKAANIQIIAMRLDACGDLLLRFWADCFVQKKHRDLQLGFQESFEQLHKKIQELRLNK